MVCLLAAPLVQLSVSAGNGWPHNALWPHWLIPISCHFRECKALLVTSVTRVSGAITSVSRPLCCVLESDSCMSDSCEVQISECAFLISVDASWYVYVFFFFSFLLFFLLLLLFFLFLFFSLVGRLWCGSAQSVVQSTVDIMISRPQVDVSLRSLATGLSINSDRCRPLLAAARDSESGFMRWAWQSVCLFVC